MSLGATYSPRTRAERMIAVTRVFLAVATLVAIWLDPSEPSHYADEAYGLLIAYVLYAGALAALVLTSYAPSSRFGFLTHAADLAIFSVFIFLTEGPTSPLFVYFVFSMLCGALRWRGRGTLWTAGIAIFAFGAIGMIAAWTNPSVEPNRFIIRLTYLCVVAGFLVYLGSFEDRVRREIQQLAEWPRSGDTSLRSVLADALRHAAAVMRSPRVVLVWEDREEPWINIVHRTDAGMHSDRRSPGQQAPAVDPGIGSAGLLCPNAGADGAVRFEHGVAREWPGRAIAPALVAEFRMESVVSAALAGDTVVGRLFFLDVPAPTVDAVVLADIVAHEVAGSLDAYFFAERLRQVAVANERISLARDLHDGFLQSLTATRLQLQGVALRLAGEPDRARDELLAIERALALEQRELRAFIDDLKPESSSPPAGSFAARLEDLRQRIERQWKLPVRLELPAGLDVPEPIANQIHLMIHEALVNVARHAAATSAAVQMHQEDEALRIVVTDDGRGFGFSGRRDHRTLSSLRAGPRSLRERVAALGGTLAVDSSDRGARLELIVPLAVARP